LKRKNTVFFGFSPVLSFESFKFQCAMKSSQTAVFAVFKKIFELTPKKVVFL